MLSGKQRIWFPLKFKYSKESRQLRSSGIALSERQQFARLRLTKKRGRKAKENLVDVAHLFCNSQDHEVECHNDKLSSFKTPVLESTWFMAILSAWNTFNDCNLASSFGSSKRFEQPDT